MLTYCVDMVADPVFLQVPRAFVNMVKVLEIIGLRDLYKETKVSCPRLILRSAVCFSPVPKGLWVLGRVWGLLEPPSILTSRGTSRDICFNQYQASTISLRKHMWHLFLFLLPWQPQEGKKGC